MNQAQFKQLDHQQFKQQGSDAIALLGLFKGNILDGHAGHEGHTQHPGGTEMRNHARQEKAFVVTQRPDKCFEVTRFLLVVCLFMKLRFGLGEKGGHVHVFRQQA